MMAINHALTGAFIGLVSGRPVVAIPVALASHFVCDAIPHFGTPKPTDEYIASNKFRNFLIFDASLCVLLVILLAIFQPTHWLLASVCAFIATSPDLAHMAGFIRVRRGQAYKSKRPNAFVRFSGAIQWFEKPIGGLVEAGWFISATVLLIAYL